MNPSLAHSLITVKFGNQPCYHGLYTRSWMQTWWNCNLRWLGRSSSITVHSELSDSTSNLTGQISTGLLHAGSNISRQLHSWWANVFLQGWGGAVGTIPTRSLDITPRSTRLDHCCLSWGLSAPTEWSGCLKGPLELLCFWDIPGPFHQLHKSLQGNILQVNRLHVFLSQH